LKRGGGFKEQLRKTMYEGTEGCDVIIDSVELELTLTNDFSPSRKEETIKEVLMGLPHLYSSKKQMLELTNFLENVIIIINNNKIRLDTYEFRRYLKKELKRHKKISLSDEDIEKDYRIKSYITVLREALRRITR